MRSSRHVQVLVDGDGRRRLAPPGAALRDRAADRATTSPASTSGETSSTPSATTTRCPYKGVAAYRSVRVGDAVHDDVVWTYPAPIPEIPKIEHHLCFFNERVDIVVDGVPLERPVSPWSVADRPT